MYATDGTQFLRLLLVIALWMVGCGGPEVPFLKDLVPATGRVTLDGKPLSGATVTFSPDIAVEGGRFATGVTDANGVYELAVMVSGITPEQSKGALPGEYVVSISRVEMPDVPPAPEGSEEAGAFSEEMGKQLVPSQYTDPQTSKLKATVAAPKAENNFDL